MRSCDRVRGTILRPQPADLEISEAIARILSPRSPQTDSYRLVFMTSLLLALDGADARGRVRLSSVFRRFSRIYWELVVDNGLRQNDPARRPLAVETLLLETFARAGGIRSLDALPPRTRSLTERAVSQIGKRRVVGAIYGESKGSFYDFDLIAGHLRFNPRVLAYFESRWEELLDRVVEQLAAVLSRFNRMEESELRGLVGSVVGRQTGIAPPADAAAQRSPRTGVRFRAGAGPLSCGEAADAAASGRSLSDRLASLPVEALVSSTAAEKLRAAGFTRLAHLEAIGADQLLTLVPVSPKIAAGIVSTVHLVRQGALDPTVSTARTMTDELQVILRAARIPDVERHSHVLERMAGFHGGAPSTLEAVGASLGVTRERARQLRQRAESAAEEALTWLDSRVLSSARSLLSQYGGLLTIRDLSALVVQDFAAGTFEPTAFLRWLIGRARDPALRLCEGDLVAGPPVGRESLSQGLEMVRDCLALEALVTTETLVERLASLWPGLNTRVVTRHAVLLAQRVAVEVLPGQFSRSAWHKTDWAELVLRRAGQPLHFSEVARQVNELTGADYAGVGFNGTLNTDPRFVRVGAGDFALAVWGARRYGRFDEVIAEYLTSQESPRHETEIVADLLRSYTVAESTVGAMLRLSDSAFIHYGGGFWGLGGRTYARDQTLESALLGEMEVAGSPRRVDELLGGLLRRGLVYNQRAIERCLYTSGLFRRCGTVSPARFAVREQLEPGAARVAAPDGSVDGKLVTADEFFSSLDWSL